MKLKGYTRPPPFPYKEKRYNLWHSLTDSTQKRFNENSKILVVDGLIASGKSTFAKALAEELDMLYLPEVDLVNYYKNDYGQSLRDLNHLLPTSVQAFDLTDFRRNPNHPNVANFHLEMLCAQYLNYNEALAHVFNTGQGVVMDRSIYSDYVFREVNYQNGYISRAVRRYLMEMNLYMRDALLRPHLVIYLDVPVDVAIQRVKERGNEWEVNSPTISKNYLSRVADLYKDDYLKSMGDHGEVMVYDWSKYGIMEIVVEDIEALRLDYKPWERKNVDWDIDNWRQYESIRRAVTNVEPDFALRKFTPEILDAPELMIPSDDKMKRKTVLDNTPGWKYAHGYNADLGDKNILFKL